MEKYSSKCQEVFTAREMPETEKVNLWITTSPRNFFLPLKGKSENAGLESNPELDPCLFMSDKVICLVYIDDTLFFLPKEEYINEIIQKLRSDKMELEEESSVAGFLGVNMTHDKDNNTVKLTQEGLTKRIIEALNIEHLPRRLTPATPGER